MNEERHEEIMNAISNLSAQFSEMLREFKKRGELLHEADNATLSTNDLIDVLGVSKATLNRLRQRRTIPFQERHDEVTGRKADDAGKERLCTAEGTNLMIEHASGSDIEGITIGNDVNALLPSEWAQCADESLEKLFVYKYGSVTNRVGNLSLLE